MNRRYQPPALSLKELPPIDAIVISHDHYDHLDKKTVLFFKRTGTEFIVPSGLGELLSRWGIPAERVFELGWNESIERRGISYTATPARHFSGRGFSDRDSRLWASWVLRGSSQSIFFSGDSGYGKHFAEIGRRYGPFDLAFIENGQYDERWPDVHMMPDETVQASIDLGAAVFVPVHWGMFTESLHVWSDPIRLSSAIASSRGLPLLAPRLGAITYARPAALPDPWWERVDKAK